ncbi:hypothetical protein GCM10023329_44520 [Streptomyces sanyensis]|uniref:Uncharacterized protein n=1 Tax=Streptomyces sanyensis TaxID=568869 RepID=A0ABP9AZL9_9ACTN
MAVATISSARAAPSHPSTRFFRGFAGLRLRRPAPGGTRSPAPPAVRRLRWPGTSAGRSPRPCREVLSRVPRGVWEGVLRRVAVPCGPPPAVAFLAVLLAPAVPLEEAGDCVPERSSRSS